MDFRIIRAAIAIMPIYLTKELVILLIILVTLLILAFVWIWRKAPKFTRMTAQATKTVSALIVSLAFVTTTGVYTNAVSYTHLIAAVYPSLWQDALPAAPHLQRPERRRMNCIFYQVLWMM